VADRETKDRKLISLMVNDLEASLNEPEMAQAADEVRALPDEEIDRMLASRLDLPYPTDEATLDQALSRVEEPESSSGQSSGGFTGAPDLSHEPRPEEREG
jgi:hypothetical protein